MGETWLGSEEEKNPHHQELPTSLNKYLKAKNNKNNC